MEITIVRQAHKPWGIDGHLYIHRKRICDTVEHPTHHLEQGSYSIGWDNNPFRHGDGALGLKNREIIVGKQLLPGVVTESQPIYDRLYERLKKAFQRSTPVHLTIFG